MKLKGIRIYNEQNEELARRSFEVMCSYNFPQDDPVYNVEINQEDITFTYDAASKSFTCTSEDETLVSYLIFLGRYYVNFMNVCYKKYCKENILTFKNVAYSEETGEIEL